MKVGIRVDTSKTSGLGHLSRCLAIAEELIENNCEVIFILSEPSKSSLKLLSKSKCCSTLISENDNQINDAKETNAFLQKEELSSKKKWDWLIVDHYDLGEPWEINVSEDTNKLLAIDDEPLRSHTSSTYVLNQGGAEGKKLSGLKYALLKNEFRKVNKNWQNSKEKKLLISFGAYDSNNVTAEIIKVLDSRLKRLQITEIILGIDSPHCSSIQDQIRNLTNIKILSQQTNMAEYLEQVDFAIGAPGVSALERCYMGIPSILIAIAENQKAYGKTIHKAKAGHYLGMFNTLKKEKLIEVFDSWLDDWPQTKLISDNAKHLIDGKGVERVCNFLFELKDID